MKLVSVVIPVYIRENQIERCIKSVLAQTYTNYEVIVVDDGSKDNSYEVAKKFESDNVIVISQKNGGVSKARNTGLKQCKGEYITFIDSDDIVAPNYLEELVNRIETLNVDLIVSNESSLSGTMDQDYVINEQDEIKKSISIFYHKCPINSVWGKLYKKELITKHFDESLSMGEDFLFNLDYLPNCNSIAYTTISLYTMPCDVNNSLSRSYIPNEFTMCSKVQKALDQYIQDNSSEVIQNRLFGIAKSCIVKSINRKQDTKKVIKEICNDSYFQSYLKNVKINRKSDQLLVSLFQLKLINLIYLMFSIKNKS